MWLSPSIALVLPCLEVQKRKRKYQEWGNEGKELYKERAIDMSATEVDWWS